MNVIRSYEPQFEKTKFLGYFKVRYSFRDVSQEELEDLLHGLEWIQSEDVCFDYTLTTDMIAEIKPNSNKK